MKTLFVFAAFALLCYASAAQEKVEVDKQNGAEVQNAQTHSLAKKLNLYIFPSDGQTKEQQEKDEFDCYKWAVEQSGVDPMNPPKVEAEQVQKGPDGAAVRGSAKGAAVGAAIGAAGGDAGKGAKVGATTGAIGGRAGTNAKKAEQQKQNNASAKAQEEELMNNFKKAFSVCLEGKGYKVSN